jgi:hypothetical protein
VHRGNKRHRFYALAFPEQPGEPIGHVKVPSDGATTRMACQAGLKPLKQVKPLYPKAKAWGFTGYPNKRFQISVPHPLLYNIPFARDPREILDAETIDLAVSAPVPCGHAAVGIAAMRQGKDYLSDKPGSTTLDQLAEARTSSRGTSP